MSSLIEISNKYYNDSLKLVKDNKVSAAINNLEKALKYYCRDIDTLNLMGLCKYKLCDFQGANFYWRKSLEYRPYNNRAQYYLDILEGEEFKEILEIYNEGIVNFNSGKYKESIQVMKDINKINKEWIEPYIMLGLAYYNIKDYSCAKRYLEEGINKDIGNNKYLSWLLKIKNNKKSTSISNRRNIMAYATMGIAIIAMTIIAGGSYRKYNSTLNELDSYKNRTTVLESQLKESKSAYDKLVVDINSISSEKKENVESTESIANESEVFNKAIEKFKEENYSEAIKELTPLCNKGKDEIYVAEGTYYLAVSLEKTGDYEGAYKWYKRYIDKFKEKNYYDDSLYNCGLMMYIQGKVDESKEMLNKLVNEVPDSIFVNSRVSEILNN
ncbi:tetratricopeptide repeat protein [uncultured Clostridium sp.]|uniref:tetratricopeptide repeat protein n=1 Tax=uncultured Clostridium sp. TaxID=59620 RepID=UPI0025EF369F|nr:tetratricopeptide repeat protein [uncultured Clostridium sp.]